MRRVPLLPLPSFGPLKLEHRFEPDEFPDGIAFGEKGGLFVSMASPAGVIILRPNVTVSRRTVARARRSPSRSTGEDLADGQREAGQQR